MYVCMYICMYIRGWDYDAYKYIFMYNIVLIIYYIYLYICICIVYTCTYKTTVIIIMEDENSPGKNTTIFRINIFLSTKLSYKKEVKDLYRVHTTTQ